MRLNLKADQKPFDFGIKTEIQKLFADKIEMICHGFQIFLELINGVGVGTSFFRGVRLHGVHDNHIAVG